MTATVSGVSGSASFSLTNNAGPAATITATAGTGQSTPTNTVFATALQATVTDASNNPLNGLTVTFTAPASGASGLFSGSATATAVTNISGVATAPTFRANSIAGGPYTVTATVPGVASAADYNLTNGPPGYTISGTVTDSSFHGIPGVTVAFYGSNNNYTATTDSSGNYTQAVPADVYIVSPLSSLYSFLPNSQQEVVPTSRTGVNFNGTALTPSEGVSPPSGAGPSADLSPNGLFSFQETAELPAILSADVLFNTSGVDNAANACHVFFPYLNSTYVQITNNAGTAPVSPTIRNFPPFGTSTNQLAYNSQCMLDTTNLSMIHNTNPDAWYFFYPLYFFPSFNGAKNVYMKLTNPLSQSGPWMQLGTWTVANSSSSDPTITITSPGATATGTVPISGAVSDPASAIGSVVVYIDGTKQTPSATVNNTAHTYTWSWKTSNSGTGVHTITVLASDTDSPEVLRAVASQTVTVN